MNKTRLPNRSGPTSKRYSPANEGQGILEFALILPILLLLVFGIIEFARAFQAWLVLSNAARFGVRYAVTGEYNFDQYCTSSTGIAIADLDGDGLACANEDVKEERILEEDFARLQSIHDVVNGVAVGILRDNSATKGLAGYFHTTICSFTGNSPDNVYMPPPDDYCQLADGSMGEDPGNPEDGTTRVLVAITFDHPVIIPLLNTILPTLNLHVERTGILENFRVARVLALPPDVNLPTVTPQPPPPATDTPTPTSLPAPVCDNYTLSDPRFITYNMVEYDVTNGDLVDTLVNDFTFDWDFAEQYGENLANAGDLRIDFMQWDDLAYSEYGGVNPYWDFDNLRNIAWGDGNGGDADIDSPTEAFGFAFDEFNSGESYTVRAQFDGAWQTWPTGLQMSDFGLTINFANGCQLSSPAVPRQLPTPTPTQTPMPDCDGSTYLPGPMLDPSEGWFAQDINTIYLGTTIEQDASLPDADREVFICGSGDDIFYTSDEFRYVARLDESGILEFKARLIGFEPASGDGGWSKAGIMIRSGTNSNAAHAHLLASNLYGSRYQFRPDTGVGTYDRDAGGYNLPVWLKMVKIGKYIIGYTSSDGVNWTVNYHEVINTIGNDFFIGLAVTSHHDGVFAKATFDNVSYRVQPDGICQYQEGGLGAVIFEAEHFMGLTTVADSQSPTGTYTWLGTTTPTGYSGSGSMVAYPNDPYNRSYDLSTSGPRMDYDVYFETPGSYYVYVRGVADSTGGFNQNDSFLLGLDGNLITNSGFGIVGYRDLYWSWQDRYNNISTILQIPSAGAHTINIWMRENGMKIDRIFLINSTALDIPALTRYEVPVMWDLLTYETPGWQLSCSDYEIPTPTITPSVTPTASATATPYCPPGACTSTPTLEPSKTPTPEPSKTPTPSPTNTAEPTSTRTPTPRPTATETRVPTMTNTPTTTAAPGGTNTPTPTPTPKGEV